MSDEQTIQVYDDRTAEYARTNEGHAISNPCLKTFIEACPTGGRVLDLGCGPGAAANLMARAGLIADAVDASAEMVAMASQHPDVNARQATFDQINGTSIYDGVWANFSLLHAPRADFPTHLAAIHAALKPNGVFYIALKLGTDESRDRLGRFYTYYTAADLCAHLETTGFTVADQVFGQGTGLDGSVSDWISVATHA
jgi:SAM-dependent methyltransferase